MRTLRQIKDSLNLVTSFETSLTPQNWTLSILIVHDCLPACSAELEVSQVFQRLNDEGIRYCHWKSNAHLADSFASKTDFDLLVDPRDATRLRDCLDRWGVRRRLGTPDKVHQGMEDYVGFDWVTGNLFHLHVHFQLIFGRKHEKNYRLPIEQEILATAVDDDVYPIRKIQPELELMVLILRALVKSRLGIRSWVRPLRGVPTFPANTINEFEYLSCQIRKEVFAAHVKRHFSDVSDVFSRMAREDVNRLASSELRQFQRRIKRALTPYRLMPDAELAKLRRAKRRAAHDSRTWVGEGSGRCIAFVGADGSGKSTTVADIRRWLGWKLSVRTGYMGIPKSDRRLAVLQFLIRLAAKARCATLKNALSDCRWVHIARHRYQTFKRGRELSQQNHVVLFDRYPFAHFRSMEQPMDGPRISLRRLVSRFERTFYDRIDKPDTTFVLQVTAEESIRRQQQAGRGACDENTIVQKVNAVNRLVQAKDKSFVLIDTHQGREAVLLNIKRKIWEIL